MSLMRLPAAFLSAVAMSAGISGCAFGPALSAARATPPGRTGASAGVTASPVSAARAAAVDLAATCSVYAQGFAARVIITPDNPAECTSMAATLSKGPSGVTAWSTTPNDASIESLSVSCDYSSPDGHYEVALLDSGSSSLGQGVCTWFQNSSNWRADNDFWSPLQQALGALQHKLPLELPPRNWYAIGEQVASVALATQVSITYNTDPALETTSAWCADVLLGAQQNTSLQGVVRANMPAPGPDTAAWYGGCVAKLKATTGFYSAAARATNPQAAAAYQSGYQYAMRTTFQDVGANGNGDDDAFCSQEDPSANASTIDQGWLHVYPGPNGQPLPRGTAWFEGCMTGLVSPSSPAYKGQYQYGYSAAGVAGSVTQAQAAPWCFQYVNLLPDPGVLAGCLAALQAGG